MADQVSPPRPKDALSDHSGQCGRTSTGVTIADPASVLEDGRTFHGYREGKYFFPNDGIEQIRLDLQHRLWTVAMDGHLSWAPIDDIGLFNVLDIGTGTGAWATEFAEQHPDAQVFGSDLSLIQPLYIPPNCEFVREDSEEDWVYPFKFDYIHLRLMFSCFLDYKGMVNKVFDHIRPGGWVEYQEFSLEAVTNDSHTEEILRNDRTAYQGWMNLMKEGSRILGRDIDVTPKLKDWLIEAGYTDVVERRLLVPISPWSSDPRENELGRLHGKNLCDAVETVAKMLYAAGISKDEFPDYVEKYRAHLEDPSLKIYHLWKVVYGRKPRLGEVAGSRS